MRGKEGEAGEYIPVKGKKKNKKNGVRASEKKKRSSQTDQKSVRERTKMAGENQSRCRRRWHFPTHLRFPEGKKVNGRYYYGMNKGYLHRWGAFIDDRRGFWRRRQRDEMLFDLLGYKHPHQEGKNKTKPNRSQLKGPGPHRLVQKLH